MNNGRDISIREKELKLMHLDHIQREAIKNISTKFINGSKIGIGEIVDAYAHYILALANLSSSGEKVLFDENQELSVNAQNYLQKFTDAILLCSKYAIHYNKVFSYSEVKNSFFAASLELNNMTKHHRNELEYKVKIALYSMLELDNAKITNYLDNIKDFYFRSLATVNPQIAKRAFIDQIVNMLYKGNNHTISDISDLANKYATYLGKEKVDRDKIEELVHKYSDISTRIHEGFLHAAKVEIFQILEGI